MAGSRVDICNMALSHLRQMPIFSMDEKSEAARACRLFYDEAVRAALRGFDWNFARREARPPLLVGETRQGWRYSFALPADCLRVRDIWRPRHHPRQRYEITSTLEGVQALHCDVPAPVVFYTAEVLEPPTWDALFLPAVTYQLAMMVAMAITGKLSNVDAMRKLAAGALDAARVEAANEDTNDVGDWRVPDWIAARGCRDWRDDCGPRLSWNDLYLTAPSPAPPPPPVETPQMAFNAGMLARLPPFLRTLPVDLPGSFSALWLNGGQVTLTPGTSSAAPDALGLDLPRFWPGFMAFLPTVPNAENQVWLNGGTLAFTDGPTLPVGLAQAGFNALFGPSFVTYLQSLPPSPLGARGSSWLNAGQPAIVL